MEIKFESPTITEKNGEYTVNYGVIKRGSDTRVDFDFYDTHYLSYSKSCSCTEPTITNKDGYFTVTVSYDSSKTGNINQFVTIKTTTADVKINVQGQII